MQQDGIEAPLADWIDFEEMERDPYPSYARLRETGPVVRVPGLDGYLLTTHETVVEAERHPELFSALIPGEDVDIVTGGRAMLHKDDPEHASERGAINPTLRPLAVSQIWRERFEANTSRMIERLAEIGPEQADLVRDFATPLAAQNIIDLVGLPDSVVADDMARWSSDYISGLDNEFADPAVWDRARSSRAEVDVLLDDLIPILRRTPDSSVTSHLLEAGVPERITRSNVHLVISGGVNEPQHMITSCTWALLENDAQFGLVRSGQKDWADVFYETLRWLSPIGMVAKVTTQDLVWQGVRMDAEMPVGLLLASANRDSAVFEQADRFDLERGSRGQLAFGTGVHQCAGRWIAKSSVADCALPRLFDRFPGLHLDHSRESRAAGWGFRGFTSLPVSW
ncbi:hypothetical protein ASF88_01800 [Leifsonia sp. Leaf336]|uniref:cytochrome P450 n=1 Tax=Leifsonia sp. Leaf336 TaxID=1736341 RepID=UPI0006F8BACB|nr:cytochrome P450 [Leifsonia sp. Leaf336]KQR53622.1 hypothetical protein ASF88_01800 [Leifsonia sp. Leaf336]